MPTRPSALTVAGSDSGGGAGIQADLKTFSALGVYGASVVTAVTAQNTREVRHIEYLSPDSIRMQMEAVLDDLTINAIKIGMLGQPAIIETVADTIRRREKIPLVVDPVMIAKSGDALLQQDAIETLLQSLLPMATVITPNIPECAALLRQKEEDVGDHMEAAIKELAELTNTAVLLKAGHGSGDQCDDLLWDGRELMWLPGQRIKTTNTHGTGCSLASAVASFLARGDALGQAAVLAKDFISSAIAAADQLNIGHGHGPIHHFHRLWKDDLA